MESRRINLMSKKSFYLILESFFWALGAYFIYDFSRPSELGLLFAFLIGQFFILPCVWFALFFRRKRKELNI
tara:strand:- start:332 stop:547 length:216 start_codon:yes stop_codon:yes gene_type:complete